MKKKLNQILKKVLNIRTSRSLQVYDNLEELNIITFWKIVQGGIDKNMYFLDKNFNKKKKYSESEEKILFDTWNILQDEYYLLSKKPQQKGALRSSTELLKMQFRVRTLLNHYEFYTKFYQYNHLLPTKLYFETERKIIDCFKELGFKHRLKELNSTEENMVVIKRFIESVINKLKLLKSDVEVKTEREITNIYENVAVIEQVLERSVGDIEKINVMQWLAYEKQANDIVSAKKKIAGNGKK